jgi:MFS family permease
LGRLSIVFALSGLLGPPIGGGLVQAFGWTSVFWLNVPLSLAGIVVAFRFLPQDEPSRRSERPDLVGASLLALATGVLTIGASNAVQVTFMGHGLGWPALVGLSLAIYAALLWWERRLTAIAGDALLDLELLRTRAYGLGLLLAFFSTGVTVTLFVLVPFWLARGWHVQTSALGLVFTPVALGIGVLAPFAGRKSDAIGPRPLTTVGMLVGGVGASLLAWQATLLIWPVLLMAMLCLGAGSGLFAAPNNNAVLSAAPQSALSVAGSMLSAARTLGVIVGVSVGGAIYDALRAQHGPNEAARVLFLAAAVAFLLNAALAWAARPETETERRSSRQDNAHALRGDFSA